jgi:hypothetical protein
VISIGGLAARTAGGAYRFNLEHIAAAGGRVIPRDAESLPTWLATTRRPELTCRPLLHRAQGSHGGRNDDGAALVHDEDDLLNGWRIGRKAQTLIRGAHPAQ